MSHVFSVRRLRMADLDRIQEIENVSFGRHAYDRNLFADYFHSCGNLFLVAERRRRICGYIITCTRGDRAELISIAVDPANRGTGAASAMLASTLRRLRLRRIARLLLMVRLTNEPARRFYDRFGFRKLRRVARYYEDGEDGLLMAKDLA